MEGKVLLSNAWLISTYIVQSSHNNYGICNIDLIAAAYIRKACCFRICNNCIHKPLSPHTCSSHIHLQLEVLINVCMEAHACYIQYSDARESGRATQQCGGVTLHLAICMWRECVRNAPTGVRVLCGHIHFDHALSTRIIALSYNGKRRQSRNNSQVSGFHKDIRCWLNHSSSTFLSCFHITQ